jgi:glycosyltransferase involved in cell wall biosynthesis
MNSDTKPTLLVFTGHYLPGYKAGGIVRSVINAVNHFHREFQFRIVTRDRDLGDKVPYENIRPRQWQTVGNSSVYYLPPGGDSIGEIRNIVTNTPHDLIRLNSFFDPLTVKVLFNRRIGRIGQEPIVLSPFGEFAWPSLRQKYAKKTLFIHAARLAKLYAPVIWHASNAVEADEIMKVMRIGSGAIRVAEDLPTLREAGQADAIPPPGSPERNALRVTFFSRISPEKNLDIALAVLKRVRTTVVFDIIGPIENAAYWSRCQKLLSELPPNVTARSLGSIKPAEVINTLSRYDLLLLPTGGEAYGHAISESLTAGTPVLISTHTPWRGLEAKGLGWDLPLDDIDAFVRVVDDLGASTERDHLRRRATVAENMKKWLRESPCVEDHRRILREALVRGKDQAAARCRSTMRAAGR